MPSNKLLGSENRILFLFFFLFNVHLIGRAGMETGFIGLHVITVEVLNAAFVL